MAFSSAMFVSFEGRRNRQPVWTIQKQSYATNSPGFMIQHLTFLVSLSLDSEAFMTVLNSIPSKLIMLSVPK